MVFEGDWIEWQLKSDELRPDLFDFFLPPTDRDPLRFCGFPEQVMVTSRCQHPEEALDFLNWLIQPDLQQRFFLELGASTATVGVAPDPAQWPRLYKWRRILDRSATYPPTDQVFVKELTDACFAVQDSVVGKEIGPKEAARRIQRAIDDWAVRKDRRGRQ
jgi:raffinose/stachyose/melibiose transport system substrate-binding protein